MNENAFGNSLLSDEPNQKVAYIVGDNYPILSELSRVITIRQFMIAVLEQRLSKHRLWIIGQGLTHDELRFLRLCETHLQGTRFHFGSQCPLIPSQNLCAESPCEKYSVSKPKENSEWRNFHFIDPTRVKDELHLLQLSESHFLAQDFLFAAARELTERACQSAVPSGILIIKQASFYSFQRLLPLPITVETKFQLMHDNKRSLKSLTRFYQDYACTAEVNLSFDLYSKEEADRLYKTLAEKTVEHWAVKIENDI